MTDERVRSTGEVARRLGVQPYRLHYLVTTGRVPEPALRVAGKRAWTNAELQAAKEALEKVRKRQKNHEEDGHEK